MIKAALLIAYPNGESTTNVLPTQQAVGWAERVAADERACGVWVVFNDGTYSTFK
jgi:hypothetical protein